MGLLVPWALVALGLTFPLSGTVEDPAGKPVEGARVWLVDWSRKDPGAEILIEAKTDAEGKFRLDRPDDLVGRAPYRSPTLWAYKPGNRVAFVEFKKHVPGADEPVRLVLGPPAGVPVRVLMPDGKPSPGAKVRPTQLNNGVPWPPAALVDLIAGTTDAEGKTVLDGLRPEDVFRVDVAIEGFVTQGHSFTPPGPEDKTVSFRRVGRLSARFVADDPAIVRGWTLTAWTTPLEPDGLGWSTSWNRSTSDEAGVVAFRPLAAGRIGWKVEPPKGSPYIAVMPPPVVIRPGELTEAKFILRKGVKVEGSVVEDPGGAPVPGAEVTVVPLQYSGMIDTPATDAEGRFSFLVLPDEFRFTLHKSPRTHFLPPGTDHWFDFTVKAGEDRHVLAPLKMKRAAQVRGKVLDEAGRPESGVSVTGGWSVQEFRNNARIDHHPTVYDTTDERGEFVLGSIAPGVELRVSARAGFVADSPSETVTAGNGVAVTLRLKKHPTLALSGRVLGPDGRPMTGVAVRILIRASNQNFDRGSEFTFPDKEVATGPDGTFKTPAEVPVGNSYRVEVRAPGMELAESPWIGSPNVEFPDLALRRGPRPPRAVTGRVVDTAGKPVAGAEVSQSGDSIPKTRDSTDADGRFKVPGIPASPAFLFVHKEGYRWTGRRVDPSDKAVDFVVTRADEPPPVSLKPAPSPISRAEERAIARDLLAPVWKALRAGPDNAWDRMKVQQAMALIDPERVAGMIENQVLVADRSILANLALGRLEDDPRAAIEDLDAIVEPEASAEALLSVFDRLAGASTLDLRRDLLDRALRRTREIQAHDQKVVLLAQVADRLFDLGDPGKATPIAREAAAPKKADKPDGADGAASARALVATLEVGGSSGVQRELAEALARVDLPAALKLIEGEKDGYSLDRLRSRLAVRVAATRPAETKRLLGLIKNDSEKGLARQLACIRMAAKDLPAARALSEGMRAPVVVAVLPAIAARELADSDPSKARALLMESFDRLGRLAEPSGTNYANPPVLAMARLLPLAARIDPDRAPGYFWFTLASRPPLAAAPERRPAMPQTRQNYANLAELAMLIAQYDRSAAEVVFGPVAERVPGLLDEMWGLGNEGDAIFKAAAGYDARAAKVLLEALPEDPAPPTDGNANGPRPRHKTKAQARIAVARMLGLSPELRRREPLRRTGGDDWLPGLEDGSTVGDLP
jgi:hypothetical protein